MNMHWNLILKLETSLDVLHTNFMEDVVEISLDIT